MTARVLHLHILTIEGDVLDLEVNRAESVGALLQRCLKHFEVADDVAGHYFLARRGLRLDDRLSLEAADVQESEELILATRPVVGAHEGTAALVDGRSLDADVNRVRMLARTQGWKVDVGDGTVSVAFNRRLGNPIPPINALFDVSGYPLAPPGLRFGDAAAPSDSRQGWPSDGDLMFKTGGDWPRPFACIAGVREYHELSGHGEPVAPRLHRLPLICSRIQQGIDAPTFRGRLG